MTKPRCNGLVNKSSVSDKHSAPTQKRCCSSCIIVTKLVTIAASSPNSTRRRSARATYKQQDHPKSTSRRMQNVIVAQHPCTPQRAAPTSNAGRHCCPASQHLAATLTLPLQQLWLRPCRPSIWMCRECHWVASTYKFTLFACIRWRGWFSIYSACYQLVTYLHGDDWIRVAQ